MHEKFNEHKAEVQKKQKDYVQPGSLDVHVHHGLTKHSISQHHELYHRCIKAHRSAYFSAFHFTVLLDYRYYTRLLVNLLILIRSSARAPLRALYMFLQHFHFSEDVMVTTTTHLCIPYSTQIMGRFPLLSVLQTFLKGFLNL